MRHQRARRLRLGSGFRELTVLPGRRQGLCPIGTYTEPEQGRAAPSAESPHTLAQRATMVFDAGISSTWAAKVDQSGWMEERDIGDISWGSEASSPLCPVGIILPFFFSVIIFSAHFSQQDVVKIVSSLSQATLIISLFAAFRCFLAHFFLKLPQDAAQQNSPHPYFVQCGLKTLLSDSWFWLWPTEIPTWHTFGDGTKRCVLDTSQNNENFQKGLSERT